MRKSMRVTRVFGSDCAIHQHFSHPLRRGVRVTVNQWEEGLLFHHGRLETILVPGGHRRWRKGYELHHVDLRPRLLHVPTQEVPTVEGVPLKITVSGRVRVTDSSRYITAVQNADEMVYLAIQIALRELVATSTIEELLQGRSNMGERLLMAVGSVEQFGLSIEQLELKDIVISSELKKAHTQVLVARAQGEAMLELARGETAALRNLANAARMAADNPMLIQLRLLQQLESSSGHTVIIGNTAPPVPNTTT